MLALLLAANLGVSHFTATGPRECQRKVLEGVLALHSFMYDDARDVFVEAQKSAPCPIAFWGEAMTYDHPLWGEEQVAPAKTALAKIPADAKLSPLERGLVEAARALYDSGHTAWMERLARLHDEIPRDDEATLFYALSLYANSHGGKDVKRAMQAAALAQDVFARNPEHPGAAHYLIHACDSPDHAILALEAAKKYAQIAPAAGHALHMPSHIFVQLGMWREVESSNLASVKAGEDAVARRKESIARADWHSYVWLAAAKLELGKADEVLPMIERVRELSAREKDPELTWVQAQLAEMWLSSSREWARADELVPSDEPALPAEAPAVQEGCHQRPYDLTGRLLITRARLDAAAALGDEAGMAALGDRLLLLRSRIAARLETGPGYLDTGKLTLAAKLAQAHSLRDSGSINEAIVATRALADAEDKEPALGPAPFTPAREELGELYMRSHRFVEAEAAFRAALEKRPGRLQALRGLSDATRAAAAARGASAKQ